MSLAEAGIKLYGGVSGSCDAAVEAFLAHNLGYNPNVKCDHHDHVHSDGGIIVKITVATRATAVVLNKQVVKTMHNCCFR